MKKKILVVVLSLCMIVTMFPMAVFAGTYTDTEGHWAETAIERWTAEGIISGFDGKFNPDGDMTRAEIAKVLCLLLKLDGKADLSKYTDVEDGAWYADYMAACVEAGIMNGTADDKLSPNDPVTREMFFTMLVRALGIVEEDALEKTFSDSADISAWAKGSVNALVNGGYVNGVSADKLAPKANITRASVMFLLDKLIAAYADEPGTVEVTRAGIVLILADDVTVKSDEDITVVVAKDDAKVYLGGATGKVQVNVTAPGANISGAPAGTVVNVADDASDTKVNGSSVAAGGEVVIATKPAAPATGGGSTGGGSTGGTTTGGTTTGGTTTGGTTTGGTTTGGTTTGGTTTGGTTTGNQPTTGEAI